MPVLGNTVTCARQPRRLITAGLLLFIGGAARSGYAKASPERTAQTQRTSVGPRGTDKNGAGPRPGCSLLSPAQIQAVLGRPFDTPKEIEMLPPFGTTSGSHCTYRSQGSGDFVLDFFVYVVTPAEAKRWFDMGEAAAKKSNRATGIGDAAYVMPNRSEIHVLKRTRATLYGNNYS